MKQSEEIAQRSAANPIGQSQHYANALTKKTQKAVPLCLVLGVPFVVQIVSAVGLVGYLSFQNGQQAVNNLVNQLDEASNGQKAVTIWERWQPHLIWMDMRMPILKILNLTDILLKQK